MSPLSRRERWALAGAALVFAAIAVHSLNQKSATYDETAHLAAGYTDLRFGAYRLNREHPPLLKEWAALPLLAIDVRFEPGDEAWRLGRQWELGRRLLFRWNDGSKLLFLARLPMVALGLAVAMAVFLWARRLWGPAGGWLSVLVCLSSPDVLAHSRLVTTDLGLALFVLLSVLALERLGDTATWPRLLGLGCAAGAALASKYSAVVLAPILALLVAVGVASPGRWQVRMPPVATRELGHPVSRAIAWGLVLALAVLVAAAMVWVAYGFHSGLDRDPAAPQVDWSRVAVDPWPLGVPESWLRASGLLPEAWHYGLLRVLKHSEARQAFLHGEVSEAGFPHFFLVSFFLKTPLPFLALLALSWSVRPARRLSRFSLACLAVPVVTYAALTLTRGLNIGHRHLLPIYPFLFVAVGRAAAWAWPVGQEPPRRGRQWLVGILAAGCLAVPLRIHPDYLAFFNALAGGPAGGHRWLVDSSLDWGQDLPALARWQRDNDARPLRLAYFGTADPAAHGLEVKWLPSYLSPPEHHVERRVERGDVVAVSATLLHGLYLPAEDAALLARFRNLDPIGHAGHSILIYRADFDWP